MKRIAIDARLTYYREGGIAAYTRHVLRELAALETDQPFFVLQNYRDTRQLVQGTNFRRVPTITPCHHRLERWALGGEIARLRLDLLHSPDFIPPAWGAKHYVITVHDLNFLHYPQFLTEESRRYYNGQIKRAVTQADHILACSEATRTDLIELLDVPPERITVHLEGVDPSFRPLPDEEVAKACEALDLIPGYLLFVGTFEPRKNIPGLVRAYRLLRDEWPDAPPLVLAGRKGWLSEEIETLVEALALADHVRWRENIPQALMPGLYNGAAALIMPSFYEGFGLPPLEAMACGTPTIVANRSSLPEVVGDAGILVNPDDPADIAAGLLRLLTDSALYERLRQAGLHRAQDFTWHKTALTVRDVYRQVLNS
ncbi:MAG: glycosyltransferase family 1 protein [Anaerolineae bacterium]